MDHVGQCGREGRVMSQLQGDAVDLCDNLPKAEDLTAPNQNLNETNTLTEIQNDERGQDELIHKNSFNNNGREEEVHRGRSREEDEEEDNDEEMKEEEEESEDSSCLIHCQSPDTPLTDSSYSETGSLLDTPYPFSPGTSPEPTSPVIPVASPQNAYPINPVELSQYDAEMDCSNSGSPPASTTGSVTCTLGPTCTTGPIDSTTQTSDTKDNNTSGPTCITEATSRIAENTISSREPVTSSTELIISYGPTCSKGPANLHEEPITSFLEASTSTAPACTTRLTTSFASIPVSAAEPITTGTESTSTTEPIISPWEHIASTPVPTCLLALTSATGPIPSPALLASLEHLAQRGDDTHLPQYLHQIAEAFVLQEDYQQALWCIQLERLYHQRILDNLNALREQWESQCGGTSSNLETQHLDTLKNICRTHSRPRAKDDMCASLDFLRTTFEEERLGGLTSPILANQVKGETEQSSQLLTPSINIDNLHSPENTENNREREPDPDQELEGRASFHGTQLTDREGSDREEGGIEYTISVGGKGLHPSAAGVMDQSKPAEQQGGDIGPTQEKEVKKEEEEREKEEAAEAVEMEDEGDEEEENQQEVDSSFSQKALPEEILVSEPEVEVQQLHQEARPEEELHEEAQHYQEAQESDETCLPKETCFPHTKQQEHGEEEEDEYGVERMDIIGEAASLDDLAKLITVEEVCACNVFQWVSPASGLVSILKKRCIPVDNVCVSESSEPRPDKPPAKRRVHFKVPEDGYEQEMGGGDSCLLLFLLCLVTVVISMGGTALYCALGDAQSSVCQDFSRNADFYISQIQRGMAQIQHWFTPGS
ncbi:hypothetical protein LDENG_00246320 [Lucifuga dentata]|nr:hypothetical protein LDENG_00246320 [Lucifuga dentata]